MKTVALFTSPRGKLSMEIFEYEFRGGVSYSYTGSNGAGSGFNADQMRLKIASLKYFHPRTKTVLDQLTLTK